MLTQVAPGEWVQPTRKGYKAACCDCGLVHSIDFQLAKDAIGRAHIQLRAVRDAAATRRLRKSMREQRPA